MNKIALTTLLAFFSTPINAGDANPYNLPMFVEKDNQPEEQPSPKKGEHRSSQTEQLKQSPETPTHSTMSQRIDGTLYDPPLTETKLDSKKEDPSGEEISRRIKKAVASAKEKNKVKPHKFSP